MQTLFADGDIYFFSGIYRFKKNNIFSSFNHLNHNQMKFLVNCTLLCSLFFGAVTVTAQKLKVKDGDPSVLKNETAINFEFTYDNMSVGKFDTEKEYMDKKIEEYNKKESGRGDN